MWNIIFVATFHNQKYVVYLPNIQSVCSPVQLAKTWAENQTLTLLWDHKEEKGGEEKQSQSAE